MMVAKLGLRMRLFAAVALLTCASNVVALEIAVDSTDDGNVDSTIDVTILNTGYNAIQADIENSPWFGLGDSGTLAAEVGRALEVAGQGGNVAFARTGNVIDYLMLDGNDATPIPVAIQQDLTEVGFGSVTFGDTSFAWFSGVATSGALVPEIDGAVLPQVLLILATFLLVLRTSVGGSLRADEEGAITA